MSNRATRRIVICTLLAFLCLAVSALAAAGPMEGIPLERSQRIARAVATVTGAAISPLFGVCVLGAYTYWNTATLSRAALPFYCAPAFWIPLAILVALVMLKDTVGSALPLMKKPLDALEILIVNKAALLFAVLPVVWHEAGVLTGPPGLLLPDGIVASVHAAAPGAPAAVAGTAPMALAFVTGAALAFAVWLAGHALDILALLSPIPLLDVVFKTTRVAVFLTVGVLALLNSRAALLVSLAVIGVSLLCFWWALRLAVFGTIFAWDLVRSRLFGRRRDPSLDGEVLGFTAHSIGGLRRRSFGALRLAADGSLEFSYRPMGIGFRSAVRLQHPEHYQVGKGLIFPCVLTPAATGGTYTFEFRLLPRYAGFEREIRDLLHLAAVRDLRVPSEIQTAWNWLHGVVAKPKLS